MPIIYGRVHECRDSVIVETIIVERQGYKAEDEDNIGDKNCYVVFQLPIKTRRRLAYPPDMHPCNFIQGYICIASIYSPVPNK